MFPDKPADVGTNGDELLKPGEVAEILRVNPKTVSKWARSGWMPTWAYHRTLGNHLRIWRNAIPYLRGDEFKEGGR
jgi:hypothetical protein